MTNAITEEEKVTAGRHRPAARLRSQGQGEKVSISLLFISLTVNEQGQY